jgi:glutamyl-Q tRNA(Asp) synthetase
MGHAYSALFTQRAAAAVDGVTLLRIEDIDTTRCKPEFELAVYQDLKWLGYDYPEPVVRQSQRFAEYERAAQRLRTADLLYPCFCSRKDIVAQSAGSDPDGSPLYPGTCRHLSPAEVASRFTANMPVQWRLRMDEAQEEIGDVLIVRECPVDDRDVHFGDERPRAIEPMRWGDVVLIRKDTPTSYHLSVVVDDEAQGVTHITRGMDLLASTDVHVLLQALLGYHSPVYAHHGLITDSLDAKLSKSAGAQSLELLREAGWTTNAVRRRLGFE